jgi:hypothetical protein
MSKYGMLGLLEGAGRGLSKTGKVMTKNFLAEAESNRVANREKVRRDWMATQEQKKYDRNRADHATDLEAAYTREDAQKVEAQTREDAQRTENRTNQIADQDKAIDNRAPSAFKEKVDWYTGQLNEKKITEDQYNTALGLSKATGLTTDQQIKYKMQANEQATLEILGKDPMKAATPEQVKAIDRRAGEIFSKVTGGSGGLLEDTGITLHVKNVDKAAKGLIDAEYDPAKDKEAVVKNFQAQNYSQESINQILAQADLFAKKKAEKAASAVPEKTDLERKVEYQVTMGDTRDPKVIADEIQRSEFQEAEKSRVPDKPIETLDSLSPNVKQAIIRQAENVFTTEGGKRSKEEIIKAILAQRAKG